MIIFNESLAAWMLLAWLDPLRLRCHRSVSSHDHGRLSDPVPGYGSLLLSANPDQLHVNARTQPGMSQLRAVAENKSNSWGRYRDLTKGMSDSYFFP